MGGGEVVGVVPAGHGGASHSGTRVTATDAGRAETGDAWATAPAVLPPARARIGARNTAAISVRARDFSASMTISLFQEWNNDLENSTAPAAQWDAALPSTSFQFRSRGFPSMGPDGLLPMSRVGMKRIFSPAIPLVRTHGIRRPRLFRYVTVISDPAPGAQVVRTAARPAWSPGGRAHSTGVTGDGGRRAAGGVVIALRDGLEGAREERAPAPTRGRAAR